MSASRHPVRARDDTTPDSNVVQLGKLMLSRAAELGNAMADLLCREIDAYRDGTVVTKDEVRQSCVANLTFVFDALAGDADVDVSPAERTGTIRALAGVPLPAVMTAYRIGFRFIWEQTLAAARASGMPTESILDATARVFLAQDTFTQAMASAYRHQLTTQILELEEERSALVEALLSRRITDKHSLWEAADLLRLPTSGRMLSWQQSCRRSESWDCPPSKASSRRATSARHGGCCRSCRSALSTCGPGFSRDTRRTCRGAAAIRHRARGNQPAVSRTGRNQRRVALCPAGGHRKIGGRFARCRL
ncbi:transcriptional regulator, PucR family [Mycobacterium kansasii]|uniref:Transcriptional regulator, PucR family n=1 Tax=Mycobacterium kansasii TaxID=1768 RepID=A0A1V3XUG1_MYCKA|nr:transcriptional regulator, PucR family [Mycobacterium kansasii]